MSSRGKVAGAIAAGFMLVWLATFMVEWHIRTGWQQHWLDGAIRAWSDFAMLEWIYSYQTLVAGLAALAAAMIAWWVAAKQRGQAIQDRIDARKSSLIKMMWMLHSEYEVLTLELNPSAHGRAEAALSRVEEMAPDIIEANPALTTWLKIMNMDIRNAMTAGNWTGARAYSYLAKTYLFDPARFFDNAGNYHPSPGRIDAGSRSMIASGIDLDAPENHTLRQLFEYVD